MKKEQDLLSRLETLIGTELTERLKTEFNGFGLREYQIMAIEDLLQKLFVPVNPFQRYSCLFPKNNQVERGLESLFLRTIFLFFSHLH